MQGIHVEPGTSQFLRLWAKRIAITRRPIKIAVLIHSLRLIMPSVLDNPSWLARLVICRLQYNNGVFNGFFFADAFSSPNATPHETPRLHAAIFRRPRALDPRLIGLGLLGLGAMRRRRR